MNWRTGVSASSWAVICALALATFAWAAPGASIGGFQPFVGIGLTNQFKNANTDLTGTFFIADPSNSWGGSPLGPGSSAFFDIALLDTGAATHILTQQAASSSGFSIQAEGFRGTQFQTIGGATGQISLRINDPLGVYAAGLGDRMSAGTSLTMNTGAMRGQTSFATLEAPAQWKLPNIIGLPMAAQHGIVIRNSDPQIFQHQGRTMRTPQVNLVNLGTGNQQGIQRRTNLKLRPGTGFIAGPLYIQNLDILGGNFNFHDNPLSPTVVENGGLFIEVDLQNGTRGFQDKEFLFDTGADFTVISELTAARLGFDVINDTPDFYLEVEGSGGVSSGVPGIFLDELNIDTVGGSFTLHNVPVAVLDVTNPNDPGNVIDGIIGMHLFNGRDLVIDANPSIGQGGVGPSLYISDPVTDSRSWSNTTASGDFATLGNWSTGSNRQMKMWDAKVAHVTGGNQQAVVSANANVFRLTVSGTPSAEMRIQIESGATLTTFGETLIEAGGRIELGGGKLDAQFVNIDGGSLAGSGDVFAGAGPFKNPVRNLSGRIEPGAPIGKLSIDGDLSNQAAGTLAFDLAGTTPITLYDQLSVGRSAFLAGRLEVSLANSFTPAIGNMFTLITAGEGVVGGFDSMQLPAGYLWNVTYNATSVVLAVTGIGLAGDFNGDNQVDAADYTVWRNTFGAMGPNLAADANGDEKVDNWDYGIWKSNFGLTAGSGSGSSTVPEPSALLMAFAAVAAAVTARVRFASSLPRATSFCR